MAWIAILASLLVSSHGFASPRGAARLTKAQLILKPGFYCGKAKGSSWVPGKLLKGGWFYSHQAEKLNLLREAKKTSGKKQKAIQQRISTLIQLISERGPVCSAGPGTSPTGTPTTTPTPQNVSLRFDLSGAVGLTLKSSKGAATVAAVKMAARNMPSSNLEKVDVSGSLSSAVSSGSATISNFLIAPNDKIYVLFKSATNLVDTKARGDCILAEVDKSTGVPICIERSGVSIQWAQKPKNDPIQFDSSGAVYYAGRVNGATVLRKYAAGQYTDLINQNISIGDFLVLPDGRVVVTGYTKNTMVSWTRVISDSNGIETLLASTVRFLKRFPDGAVYMGTTVVGAIGVFRYVVGSDGTQAEPYIGSNFIQPPTFDVTSLCSGASRPSNFCAVRGSHISNAVTTESQRVYAISGLGSAGDLMQYYPALTAPKTSVKDIVLSQGILNRIVLAGRNASGQNILTLFDTSDNSEIQLIGPEDEIEIYNLNYAAATNRIMFDGLRFADNEYVIGQYDLGTMTLIASRAGISRLEDFKTF